MSPKQQTLAGAAIGFVLVFVISVAVFLQSNPGFSLSDYFEIFVNGNILVPTLSISLLGNLAAFYIFLNLNKDNISRGILISTVLVGVLILVLKLLI